MVATVAIHYSDQCSLFTERILAHILGHNFRAYEQNIPLSLLSIYTDVSNILRFKIIFKW